AGSALRGGLPAVAAVRRRLDPVLPADRLSHGLRHCTRQAGDAAGADDAGDPAVLDQLAAAHLRDDRHLQGERLAVHGAGGGRRAGSGRGGAAQQPRGVHRHRLQLPAVHGAAAGGDAHAARLHPARGGRGPRREAGACFPAHHPAAVDARHHRRLPAGVHSGGGRVRDPRPARRTGRADHRPGAVDRVLHQPRLAACFGGGGGHAAADRDPDPGVRVHREPTRTARGRGMKRQSWWLWAVIAAGYAFLYIPIVSVIVYSFSASRLATVWGGFSLRWYGELFGNQQILDALGRSLVISATAATAAVFLGTASGMALSRFGRFPGRGVLSLMNSAPMVMPDVMLGLSSLLLFVSLQQMTGWPQRGMTTIMLAHITLTTCYVTVVV